MIKLKHTSPVPPRRGQSEAEAIRWIQKWWAKSYLGIDNARDFAEFMEPQKTFPNPLLLMRDCQKAVGFLDRFLADRSKRVLVFGDYDTDGITSSSILRRFFEHYLGKSQVEVFIPDRFRHGFGPTDAAIRSAMVFDQFDLVVFVDTGSGLREQVVKMKDASNADVLIIDHHDPEPGDFPVIAHLNPKVSGNEAASSLLECSAAGLAYLFVAAFVEHKRHQRFIDLDALMVIAAVGTVGDVCNLRGVNRSIVVGAIEASRDDNFFRGALPNLYELIYELGAAGFDEKSIGWKIAPAINALSRLGRSTGPALQLFSKSDDSGETAKVLAEANKDRQNATSEAFEAVANRSGLYPSYELKACQLHVTSISEGLIGLVAGRFAKTSNMPCFIGSVRGDVVKFSGRTPDGRVSLARIVEEAKKRKILISGGGHERACGFSIRFRNLDAFACLLDELVPGKPKDREIMVMGDLAWLERSSAWVDAVEALRPFGGSDLERPRIVGSKLEVMTFPVALRRRSDNEIWAYKFHLGAEAFGSVEVVLKDLEMIGQIKRGLVFDCVLQPEVSSTLTGNYVNWNLLEFWTPEE